MIRSEFNNRKQDIESAYQLASFVNEVNTLQNNGKVKEQLTNKEIEINDKMQKCIRAEMIILLYNAVESTVLGCIRHIGDKVTDGHYKYEEMINSYRTIWINLQFGKKSADNKISEIGKSLMDGHDTTELEYLHIDFADLGGNLSHNMIDKLFNHYGCALNFSILPNTNDYLNRVKNSRNDLAHGLKSYSEVANLYTVQEIEMMKNCLLDFLDKIITRTEQFINNKEYLITP